MFQNLIHKLLQRPDYYPIRYNKKTRRKALPDLTGMMYGKVPPQAKELEEAVLGAIMLEKSAFDTVIEILKPECFYVDANQRIYRAMQSLAQKSLPIDLLTVVEELKFKRIDYPVNKYIKIVRNYGHGSFEIPK